VDVSDFVSKTYKTPFSSCFVDNVGDVHIQGGALFENVVERELTNLRTHGRLRQLRDCEFGILNPITIYLLVAWTLPLERMRTRSLT
jgi:hypothetical protein